MKKKSVAKKSSKKKSDGRLSKRIIMILLDVCKKIILGFLIIIALYLLVYLLLFFIQPKTDLDWPEEHGTLASVVILNDTVEITHIRNMTYDASGPTSLSYYDQTYALSNLSDLWFVVEPFGDWDKVAHTYLVFDFWNGTNLETVSLSIEARAEVGEEYGPIKGLFKQFETIYVWASEDDHTLRRTNWLNHTLYYYRLNVSEEFAIGFLRELAKQTNNLHTEPEFYHTIASSCTSAFTRHVNFVRPGTLHWWDHEQYFPGVSDRMLAQMGYLDVSEKYPDFRQTANVTGFAQSYIGSNSFSEGLRAFLLSN